MVPYHMPPIIHSLLTDPVVSRVSWTARQLVEFYRERHGKQRHLLTPGIMHNVGKTLFKANEIKIVLLYCVYMQLCICNSACVVQGKAQVLAPALSCFHCIQ